MKSGYLIYRDTLEFVRDLYRRTRPEHPDCQIGFGWGGDSTGRVGVNCGFYDDRSRYMPPIYYFEEVPIHFAFPDNIPEIPKSGVLCFRDHQFRILPAEDFDESELVEGVLEDTPEA